MSIPQAQPGSLRLEPAAKVVVILAAVLALIAIPVWAHADAAGARELVRLRLGVEAAYPPFNEMGPDGRPRGLDIDMGDALCAQMRARCTWVLQDWDGMLPALLAGKFDAIVSSMTITRERRQRIAFTDPYYTTTASLAALRGAAYDLAKPATLRGLRLGVQRSTPYEAFAKAVLAREGVTVVSYPAQDEVFSDLRNGRVDASLQDAKLAALSFLDRLEGRDFSQVGRAVDDPAYFGAGIGIGLRKGDTSTLAAFNGALAAIRANGVYDRIVRRWDRRRTAAGAAPTGFEPVGRDMADATARYAGAVAMGALVTLELSTAAFLAAAGLGLAAAGAQVSGGPMGRAVGAAYATSMRCAPDFIWLLLFYYGGQALLNAVIGAQGRAGAAHMNAFAASIVILGVVYGGYLTETFRGALMAVSGGQAEAGRAFGLRPWQVFLRIVAPQMLRFALPGLTNNWLVVVKASAMTSMVSVNELLFMTTAAGRATHRVLPFLCVAAGVYLSITTVSVVILHLLARTLNVGISRPAL